MSSLRLPSIITQKPITKAICFDVSNTLTRSVLGPGKSLLKQMEISVQKNYLSGTTSDQITGMLQCPELETRITNQFYKSVSELNIHWPDYGNSHNINRKLWWKNAVYNMLTQLDLIEDSYLNLRENVSINNSDNNTVETLKIINPNDDAIDSFAATSGITISLVDSGLNHNMITFPFDEYFNNLFNYFSSPLSYELFPDSRSFINFIYGHFFYQIVIGLCSHDAFECHNSLLRGLRFNYFDFVMTEHVAKCSKLAENSKFYEITKMEIFNSIKNRMINAEIEEIYGNQKNYMPYDKSVRNILYKNDKLCGSTQLKSPEKEAEILDAYDQHFDNMVNDNNLDVIMIGNSLTKDIMPPLLMGWRVVWLLRKTYYRDLEDNYNNYVDMLNEEGIKNFGKNQWENVYKQRVLIVDNLFDIHHYAFLWE